MSAKHARGTKRTCQNGDCGSRFYDLNRDPIVCPVCGSGYEIASAPLAVAAAAADKNMRKPKRPEFTHVEPAPAGDVEVLDGDEALAEAGAETEEPVAAAADETFLEEEEDGGDVSNILGGPVAEGDEER